MIRKIMTREEQEKKRERTNKIIVIVLGLIMLMSTAGYFANEYASGSSNNVVVNNIKFKQNSNGYWDFSLNGNNYETRYNPQETANISITVQKNIGVYTNKPLYFGINTLEDVNSEGASEITRVLSKNILKSDFACLSQNCSEDYAIKDCSIDNIIIFQKSITNSSRVYDKDNCVVIEYTLGESELASDAFIFRIFGLQ